MDFDTCKKWTINRDDIILTLFYDNTLLIERKFKGRKTKYYMKLDINALKFLLNLLNNDERGYFINLESKCRFSNKANGITICKNEQRLFLSHTQRRIFHHILHALIAQMQKNDEKVAIMILLSLIGHSGRWRAHKIKEFIEDPKKFADECNQHILYCKRLYKIWCENFNIDQSKSDEIFNNMSRFILSAWDYIINPNILFDSIYNFFGLFICNDVID